MQAKRTEGVRERQRERQREREACTGILIGVAVEGLVAGETGDGESRRKLCPGIR